MFKNKTSGLTLTEVLVSAGIAGIIILGIIQSLVNSSKSQNYSKQLRKFNFLSSAINQITQNPNLCYSSLFLGTPFTPSTLPPTSQMSLVPQGQTLYFKVNGLPQLTLPSPQIVEGLYFQLIGKLPGTGTSSCIVPGKTTTCELWLEMFRLPKGPGLLASEPPLAKKIRNVTVNATNQICSAGSTNLGWLAQPIPAPPLPPQSAPNPPTGFQGVCNKAQYIAGEFRCPNEQYVAGFRIWDVAHYGFPNSLNTYPFLYGVQDVICCPVVK